ncbi:hypothetical protein GCM10023084_56410 [Streptomyces lacrimifluminis]|uniref:Caspase domain-containing protein n=2 Tax=Streptomyces lacrimifluminis TaxID=1500077 RepID=A0A917KJB4_9ACTN|nr:hypothetical protein GCM10012282_10980 [Streptomyces lacrimifluminis]
MSTQLAASGYSVRTLGRGDDGPVERNDITTALEQAAQEECELLLVYFTGHGVHVRDTDYLVPGDALAPEQGQPWSKAQTDSLLPVDVTSYLAGCRAESVVYVVDACRNSGPDDVSAGFGAPTVHAPSKRLALLVGCGRGQRCHYDDSGSYFTRALAEVLDPYAPKQSLEKVFREAKHNTTAYAQRAGEQQPHMSCAPRDEELSDFQDLCEGTEIPLLWREEAEKSSLWAARRGEEGQDSAMRKRVAAFAHECAVSVLKDRPRFDDPWSDPNLPTRTVNRVLPELLRGDADRSPMETGLLVGLPFLREAMWARKLSRLYEAEPFDLDPVPGDAPLSKIRADLQYVHESHPQLLRKARGHSRRDETEAHRALAAWLAHRWVAEQLIDPPDSGGRELIGRLATALLGPGQEHGDRAEEFRWLLENGMQLLADEPVDLPAYNRHFRKAPPELTTSEGPQPVRWWGVLSLVRLAGLLAADVRQFPDVLPDHVGVADPLLPAEIVETLQSEWRWAPEEDGLDLNLVCPHPALHEGLTDLARRAEAVLRSLRATQVQLRDGLPGKWPSAITTHQLRPSIRRPSTDPLYSTPLLRFELAQDEIRELLMGHQLYGDRSLAVRELYQNAADACRYRELRRKYLDLKGGAPHQKPAEIRITQGREPSGRAYIECRDNGVGMGRTQLEQTFSRAGRRFSQTRAFRQEQARWLEQDPELRLYPYSRFGIGVLSYFMIADEVTLVTREVDAEGHPVQDPLVVNISSSSGLFRIRRYEGDDDPMREGGTRVRLMLSEPEGDEDQVSAFDVLRDQVRWNEYELVLTEDSGRNPEIWSAGELRHPVSGDASGHVDPLNARGPVWWVADNGMVLADGIVTSEEPFGYVVNLTGPQAPQLSVNRNSLLSWNEDWATEQVRRAAADLPGWVGLDLEWLWRLENNDVELARAIAAELAGKGLSLPARRSSSHHWPDVFLDSVGWFPDDSMLLAHEPGDRRARLRLNNVRDSPTVAWRLAVLRSQGLKLSVEDPGVMPKDVTGYPVPRPGDSVLLNRATGSPRNLVTYSFDNDRSVAEALRELRRFALVGPGIRVHPVTAEGTPELDIVPDRVDMDLVNWMRDWSKPDRAGRQPAAGALLSISAASRVKVGQLLERCRRFAPLGLEVPIVPADRIADHVATIRDAELLAGWTENEHAYCPHGLPRNVLPVHIARLADRLRLTSAEVLAELRDWEFLGYRLPSEAQLLSAAPTSDQWDRFSKLWDPRREIPDPTLRDLLVEATQQEMTIDAYLRSVGDLAGQAGVQLPEIHPRSDGLPRLEQDDLKLLVRRGTSRELLPGQSIPIDFLASCYIRSKTAPGLGADLDYEEWDVVDSRVRRVAALGMTVPTNLDPLRRWMDLPPRDRVALFVGSLDPDVPWTTATLVHAAGELGESLKRCARRLAVHESTFGKKVPALPEEALSFKPSGAEATLMTKLHGRGMAEPIQVSWIEITPFHLARYAHEAALTIIEALDQLAPYRALGALVPELTDDQAALMAKLRPDQHDLLALSERMALGSPREASPFKPLELVAVAGRLGRPVRAVYERLRLYEPLGVTLDVPHAPNTLPLWQDLVLLSEGLNGQEPALHGAVSAAQVEALARELDTTSHWVTERLSLYAGMFQLHVTPTESTTDSNEPQEQET